MKEEEKQNVKLENVGWKDESKKNRRERRKKIKTKDMRRK